MDRPESLLAMPVAHALTLYESLHEALGFVREHLPDDSYVPPVTLSLAQRNLTRWAGAWAAINDLDPADESGCVAHARAFIAEHAAEYLAWERRVYEYPVPEQPRQGRQGRRPQSPEQTSQRFTGESLEQ